MSRFFLQVIFLLIFSGCSDLVSNHPELGNGYKFFDEDKYGLSIVNSENTVLIRHHVLNYAFDSVYVLVIQRPFSSVSERKSMSYSDFNKAFNNSSIKNYWIIDKSMECRIIGFDSINQVMKYSNVFGPYTKKEYLLKREILGVPKKLRIE